MPGDIGPRAALPVERHHVVAGRVDGIGFTEPGQQAHERPAGSGGRRRIARGDQRDMDCGTAPGQPRHTRGWPPETALEEVPLGVNQVVVAEILPAERLGLVHREGAHEIEGGGGRWTGVNLVDNHAERIATNGLCGPQAATPVSPANQGGAPGQRGWAEEDGAAGQARGEDRLRGRSIQIAEGDFFESG